MRNKKLQNKPKTRFFCSSSATKSTSRVSFCFCLYPDHRVDSPNDSDLILFLLITLKKNSERPVMCLFLTCKSEQHRCTVSQFSVEAASKYLNIIIRCSEESHVPITKFFSTLLICNYYITANHCLFLLYVCVQQMYSSLVYNYTCKHLRWCHSLRPLTDLFPGRKAT